MKSKGISHRLRERKGGIRCLCAYAFLSFFLLREGRRFLSAALWERGVI